MKNIKKKLIGVSLGLCLLLTGCTSTKMIIQAKNTQVEASNKDLSVKYIEPVEVWSRLFAINCGTKVSLENSTDKVIAIDLDNSSITYKTAKGVYTSGVFYSYNFLSEMPKLLNRNLVIPPKTTIQVDLYPSDFMSNSVYKDKITGINIKHFYSDINTLQLVLSYSTDNKNLKNIIVSYELESIEVPMVVK